MKALRVRVACTKTVAGVEWWRHGLNLFGWDGKVLRAREGGKDQRKDSWCRRRGRRGRLRFELLDLPFPELERDASRMNAAPKSCMHEALPLLSS